MVDFSLDEFLSRLIGDGDFRETFYLNPLNACSEGELGLTWSEMAALLSISEPMLAEFAKGIPSIANGFWLKDDTTNRVTLRSH